MYVPDFLAACPTVVEKFYSKPPIYGARRRVGVTKVNTIYPLGQICLQCFEPVSLVVIEEFHWMSKKL